MRLFNTLCLEISARCNRKCSFCPVAYNTRPDEKMDKSLFNKALRELADLKYNGRVELYIYNEPLQDLKWLEYCIRKIRACVPKCCIMVASNGDYIRSTSVIRDMYDWGLNQLLINCYSAGLYDKRLKWLDDLPEEVEVDGPIYSRVSSRKKTFQILDKSTPEEFGVGVFRLVNRAGNIPEFIAPLEEPVERMCVKPFRLLNIDWKGNALVCCQDYHASLSFGNLKDTTLLELWNHPVINRYRKNLLNKDRTLPLCNQCDCHAGAYPHMVDTNIEGDVATIQQVKSLYNSNKSP